jgi:signal transduction histidine kinase
MTIRTGANQLELAFLNIALNARDAMPDGNRLQLVVRHENVKAGGVRSLNAGEYVCIAVTDTGGWKANYPAAAIRELLHSHYGTRMTGKGQPEKSSRREFVFRSAPESRRKRAVPTLTFSAISRHRATAIGDVPRVALVTT